MNFDMHVSAGSFTLNFLWNIHNEIIVSQFPIMFIFGESSLVG